MLPFELISLPIQNSRSSRNDQCGIEYVLKSLPIQNSRSSRNAAGHHLDSDASLPILLLHLVGRREELLKVTFPACRVFALSQTHHLGPVQNGFDALPDTRGGLVLGGLYWPQNSQYVLKSDRGDGHVANYWEGIGGKSRAPLFDMFDVLEFALPTVLVSASIRRESSVSPCLSSSPIVLA